MTIPYSAGTAFTTATCVNAWVEYPFANLGDVATKVYHHTMQQERLSYAPLAFNDVMTAADEKPTRSPFADDSAAYWVEDSTTSDIGGTLVEFQRSFANIPADRIEPNGLYPFEFPGNSVAQSDAIGTSTGGYVETVTSSSGEQMKVDVVFTLSVADAAKLSTGETITIKNNTDVFNIYYGYGFINISTISAVVTSIVSTTITAEYSGYYATGTPTFNKNPNATFTTYDISRPGFKLRDKLQDSTTSAILYTYEKLSNVTDASPFAEKFVVLNSAGTVTDNLAATTLPTSAQYYEIFKAGGYINAEDETFERWRGNIYERKIIQVVAK